MASPPTRRQIRDALDRFVHEAAVDGDQELLQHSDSWSTITALRPEMRPEDNGDPDSFTHELPGITALRSLLWSPELLAVHPVGGRQPLAALKYPGVFQSLWFHLASFIGLEESHVELYTRASIGFAHYDVLSDARTGITVAEPGMHVHVPRRASYATVSQYRNVAWLQIKRQIGVLHERTALAPSELKTQLEAITSQITGAIGELHEVLLGHALPPHNTSEAEPDESSGLDTGSPAAPAHQDQSTGGTAKPSTRSKNKKAGGKRKRPEDQNTIDGYFKKSKPTHEPLAWQDLMQRVVREVGERPIRDLDALRIDFHSKLLDGEDLLVGLGRFVDDELAVAIQAYLIAEDSVDVDMADTS